MIALTQEKRQKRINWLNTRISSMEKARDELPFGLSEDEEMELAAYKDSLASLTADIFGYVDGSGLNFYRHPSATIEYAIEQGDKVAALFTSPPVPEIKLRDIPTIKEVNEIHPAPKEMMMSFKDGTAWMLSEIESLNGVGE